MLRRGIMPISRTAIDTITGYYYQFDYYILQLLNCEDGNNKVCIEAIEDVDIKIADETTAVQCKYYAKTEYNHSVIARPIRLMLDHFKQNTMSRNTIYYKLYGHFKRGESKLTLPITLDFLKEKFLTYIENGIKHEYYKDLNLSDGELLQFLGHLTININAMEFSIQERAIIAKIKELFRCNEFEAEYYYYNNALRVVRELSTKQNIQDRTISSREFKERINVKSELFDIWFLEFKGEQEYCRAIKQEYFSTLNISPYARLFLIDCDSVISETALKSLILKISKNWSRLSAREPRPFCPYICLHGVSERTILNIKKALQNDDVFFIDGYDFKGADFKAKSIVRKPNAKNGIKLKFITEIAQIDDILNEISTTRIIYQFFLDAPYYKNKVHQMHLIKIPSTDCISNMI